MPDHPLPLNRSARKMPKIKAPAACPRIFISRGWFKPSIVLARSGDARSRGHRQPFGIRLSYCTSRKRILRGCACWQWPRVEGEDGQGEGERQPPTFETRLIYRWRFTLDTGTRRAEFKMNAISEETCTTAASSGVRVPAAARHTPNASTTSVPTKLNRM